MKMIVDKPESSRFSHDDFVFNVIISNYRIEHEYQSRQRALFAQRLKVAQQIFVWLGRCDKGLHLLFGVTPAEVDVLDVMADVNSMTVHAHYYDAFFKANGDDIAHVVYVFLNVNETDGGKKCHT